MFTLRVQTQSRKEVCFSIVAQDAAYLWHCKFGHLSYKGLEMLYAKDMVIDLPKLPGSLEVCEDCMKGKQHRDTIPKQSKWRADQKLGLVHADLCGPITPASNSNRRYVLSLIDDFTRKSWVYFLIDKSEALHHFKYFKAYVEKEVEVSIKCL